MPWLGNDEKEQADGGTSTSGLNAVSSGGLVGLVVSPRNSTHHLNTT